MMNQTLQLHNATLFLQEYQFSVSPVACMCIGSVDSSKFPNYFFTGTTC